MPISALAAIAPAITVSHLPYRIVIVSPVSHRVVVVRVGTRAHGGHRGPFPVRRVPLARGCPQQPL